MTPAEKKQAIGDALDYWYLIDFLSFKTLVCWARSGQL